MSDPPRSDIRERMERMYRPQTAIYDLTRKYYLVGRDALVDGLEASAGDRVLDLGCGTGRNLVRLARAWPDTQLFGIDASAAMLERASRQIDEAGLGQRVRLARADGERSTVAQLFGEQAPLDHVVISYALSMMDRPLEAVEGALAQLRLGGRLHIVDFGPMMGVQALIRRGLVAWLDRFGVHHRPEVGRHLAGLRDRGAGQLETVRFLGGYAVLNRFTRSTTGS